jgi:carboxypeptidase D
MLQFTPFSQWRQKYSILLLLSSLIVPIINAQQPLKTQADYFVHSLPGAPENEPLTKMFAGTIEVKPEVNANLFFWFFENKHIADKSRLVIWFNGGPGCSSEDGALMEIGPYRVREGGKLESIDGSWNEFANLLFIDNPVGTGFSYVDTNEYVRNLGQMAEHIYIFLEKWFEIFPEYMHDEVSSIRFQGVSILIISGLHRWRILCRSTHSLHYQNHTVEEQGPKRSYQCPRTPHWQWLAIWC